MQIKRSLLAALAFGAIFALSALTQVQAQEKAASPAGTWTWTQQGRNGGPGRTNTMVLKVEGEKVTGTISNPGRNGQTTETTIENGKVAGDQVSFSTTREFNGNKMTAKYSGKVSADAIKGKIEFERDGNTQSRDWEAKRVK